jgi:hypothetical protein
MTSFQMIALPVLGLLIVVTAMNVTRRRMALRAGIGWMLLWSMGAVAVADPDLVVRAATLAGIGRGVDLVVYVAILVIFAALFLTYLRFRRLDEQITKIVRHLAIAEAPRQVEGRQPSPEEGSSE